MSLLANFIGYQLVWFIAVIAAARNHAWPGIAAALFFATSQFALSTQRILDARLVLSALLCGIILDGTLAASGWLQYAAPSPALPAGGAPLWILALWLSFSLTLTRSLAWLQRYPAWAFLLAAGGAPLAYVGAARGWQAVNFVAPAWHALACLAAGWVLAMALWLHLLARARRTALPA